MYQMRKENIYLNIVNSYIIDSPQPSSINYWYNLGSLLGLCLIIQVMTGIILAIHYSSNIILAFESVDHIIRDVNIGWILRYIHSNGASLFFICIYIHIGKALYYGSYRYPRTLVWEIGVIIIFMTIATAFIGYCLVYGQISIWGATVITNLFSAIPLVGIEIVSWIWGGFSVGNPTIQRFYAFHYILPFIIIGLVIIHIMALHTHGSSNPLGMTGNIDRLPIHVYFVYKDLVTILALILLMSILVFYMPNILGDPANSEEGNPIVTPSSIVPEWYLLAYYAILRSIESKIMGVLTILGAIIIILMIPFLDRSIMRGNAFKWVSQLLYWIFIINFIILSILGIIHVEPPYIEIGRYCTEFYFIYIIVLVPLISILENVLFILSQYTI
jgi:ubiquinol-cytochrome c reductase cytochrome b subunit